MTEQLTVYQKNRFTEPLLARDYQDQKPFCFYCDKEFTIEEPSIWEHLNGDEHDNRFDNLVWAHQHCNVKKSFNFDWQIRAIDKLKENVRTNFLREYERDKKSAKLADTDTQTTTKEIDINIVHNKIAQEYLIERLGTNENPGPETELDFADSLNCITYMCLQKTGNGSNQAIRNYLDVLTCSIASFEKVKVDGRTVIRRRTEN